MINPLSRVCVALGNIERKQALDLLKKEELCELRLDLLPEFEPLEELLDAGAKCIVTCRKNEVLTDQNRRDLLHRAVLKKVYAIDLDLSDNFKNEFVSECKANGVNLILSHHDFESTPELSKLLSMRENAFKAGADICKLATLVRSPEDTIRLFSLLEDKRKQIIIGMGELGKITRVSAPFLGSLFTYVSPPNSPTAPGQLEADELRAIWKMIGEFM